ncbi:MAG: hypothetical protein V7K68_07525 [Nostoc sp.]
MPVDYPPLTGLGERCLLFGAAPTASFLEDKRQSNADGGRVRHRTYL